MSVLPAPLAPPCRLGLRRAPDWVAAPCRPRSFCRLLGIPCCLEAASPRAEITRDRLAERRIRGGAVAVDAAVPPFDPAIAERDAGFGKHDQPAFEAPAARDGVKLVARRGVKTIIYAHHDVRRGEELAKASAGQRRNFGEWLPGDQGRRELSR